MMRQRFDQILQVYREGLRMDWIVLSADALGLAIVVAVFIHARLATDIIGPALEIASASGY